MRGIAILIIGICLLNGRVNAQTIDSKYGVDSTKTIEQASIYTEFVKQKNYKDALPAWRYVFHNAPRFQLNTYARGEEIMIGMFSKTKNQVYVDSLMLLYDQWIKYYGDHERMGESYVLGRKGFNLYRLGKKEAETIKQAFSYLMKAYEEEGYGMQPQIVMMTFAVADDLLKRNQITSDEYVNLYMKFSDFAEKGVAKGGKKAEACGEVKSTLDALFFNAGVADCTTLNKFLTARYEKDKDNVDVLREVSSLLRRGECMDLPLYTAVAEALYRKDPTAEAAYNLAIMFLRRQELEKTEAYLKEAIEKSTDNGAKADYYFRMAQIKLTKKQLQEAKRNAQEALKLNPNMGPAYILIGNAYAAYSKNYGEDDFDHASVFWIAVDKFVRAKQVDPNVAEEADKLINAYSPHFPSKDEAFFRNVMPGSSVQIGDWIGETTNARFR